ncbi:MAG: DEAD/DEAH box helicase [Candidatus Margulisbacteria bacterium]|nr:DEAD/DEAH box helicase [Candidatus Margulisiibacteriota bacterium]
MPHTNFFGLGIAPGILDLLQRLKFTVPTPIQQKAIPDGIAGKDIIGVAQTGTGKTLAFGIPMVQRLAQLRGRGLVLVPTRELALQVDESLRKITSTSGIRTVVLIGGASMYNQVKELRRQPRILVATPGRLIDHLEQHTADLRDVEILILDEADRMLDMGFAPQIEKIMKHLPRERQTMLFSATMPPEIIKMARTNMKLPVQVEIAPTGTAAEKVTQEVFIVTKDDKPRLLAQLLDQYHGTVLLFSRTKRGASRIARGLRNMRHNAAEIHSDRSLSQRREALEGFKSGKYRILVATDIAARGIDVTGIELVLNYDLPEDAENYVHRIGRTGRAGQEGHAISFATPEQRGDIRDIERLIRTALPISKRPGLSVEFQSAAPSFQPRRHPPRSNYRYGSRGRR